jgi:hypothetical protein
VIIDAWYLLENEDVLPGITLEMTAHKVSVGVRLNIDDVAAIQEKISSELSLPQPSSAPSLNFAKGVQFEKDIRSKFGHSVNFTGGFIRREFLLVISFGR